MDTKKMNINELVATEVMGDILCDNWVYFNMGSAGGPAYRKECEEHDNCIPRELGYPKYSEDISHAWMVVKKMLHDGWQITVWCYPHGYVIQIGQYKNVDKETGDCDDWEVDLGPDKDFCKLVCRAILDAKGIDYE